MIGEGWKTVHNNFELIYKSIETEKKYGEAETVNERIIIVTIKLAGSRMSLIQVYAPHQGRPQEEGEHVYQKTL